MSFPRYPKYKASGVEWLGEVPEGWAVRPLKTIALGTGTLFIDGDWIESKDISNAGIRYLTSGNVGEGFYKEQGQGFITDETFNELKCTEVLPGDLLISRLNLPIGRACIVPDLGGRIVTCVDNVVVRPAPIFSRQFCVYLLSCKGHLENTEVLGRGATMPRLSRSALGRLPFAFPPLAEQTAIAEFLDRETGKIDELVAEQRRLIELLKEKRQAVISHAVTKGLNPHAPMKPSGIEWLGDVPASWSVLKLGNISRFKGGAGFPDSYQGQTDNEIPFFKVGDMAYADAARVMRRANHTVTEATAKELRAFVFPENTIVFAKVGAALLLKRYRLLGQKSCIDNNMMGMTGAHGNAVDYLLYVLPLLDLELIVNPGAVPSINEGQISSQRIALPPIDEQRQIVEYLDAETAKLDTLSAEAQRTIDLLQERRAALISAAVTGHIDVREQIPN